MRIDVDVSSLKSDEVRHNDHMRTMAIETDLYPTAMFLSTSKMVLFVRPGRRQWPGHWIFTARRRTHNPRRHPGGLDPAAGPARRRSHRDRRYLGLRMGSYFDMKQPNLSYVTVEADPTLEFQVFFEHESSPSALGKADNQTRPWGSIRQHLPRPRRLLLRYMIGP